MTCRIIKDNVCALCGRTASFLYSLDESQSSVAIPLLRRLFAGLSTRRPEFDLLWLMLWTKWHCFLI